MQRLTLVFICLLIWLNPAYAATSEDGFWATASASKTLSETWTGNLFIQSRSLNGVDTLERYLLRPSIAYRLNQKMSVSLGYDVHFVKIGSGFTEQRLWQELLFKRKMASFQSVARFRLEERFFDGRNETSYRPRILLGVAIPTGLSLFNKLVLRNEIFFTLNDIDRGPQSGFDQNRLFAGFQLPLGNQVKGEVGYQNQYINPATLDDISIHQLFIAISINLDQ